MKSIKTKILLVSVAVLLISLISVASVFGYMSIKSTEKTLGNVLKETAKVGAENSENSISLHKSVFEELGVNPLLSNGRVSAEEKASLLNDTAAKYGFDRVDTVGRDGMTADGENVLSEEYYIRAIKGESFISTPVINNSSEAYIIVSAPIWADGKRGGTIAGVIYGIKDAKYLSDLACSVLVGETGYGYIADGEGTTIGDEDFQLVLNKENSIKDSETDAELLALAELEIKATEGIASFELVHYDGEDYFFVTNPIGGTDNWYFGILITYKEVMAEPLLALKICIAIAVAAIILGSVLILIFSGRMARPIRRMEEVISRVADGNYEELITYESKDEIGSVADSLRRMLSSNNAIINDISRLVNHMSEGNFNIAPEAEYVGKFIEIRDNVESFLTTISHTIGDIQGSADHVSAGADEVSRGAQALSQSSTEQAASLEELSASIEEIANNVKLTTENTAVSREIAKEAGMDIESSNASMGQMLESMDEIYEKSQEIEKIIKTIDDIAFQTNILALNAAVEAARAGASGKGFAVVADEVRNLAQKSAEAAKGTTELIQGTLGAVSSGNRISQETAGHLKDAVDKYQKLYDNIEEVGKAAETQAVSISQIKIGIEQIASVVQSNSATSEESAAASEELNAQASMLKELTGQFLLKNTLILDKPRPAAKMNI